jgi:hypothetical protein
MKPAASSTKLNSYALFMENLDEYFKRYEISVLAFFAAAATTTTFVELVMEMMRTCLEPINNFGNFVQVIARLHIDCMK